MKTPMEKAENLKGEILIKNLIINNMGKLKIYHIDADFARLCGIELTENEFTEVKVDNNGQVTNPLNNGGKENED